MATLIVKRKIKNFILAKDDSSALLSLQLFLIATNVLPETLVCIQSVHTGSYNFSSSTVQLTAPEQSFIEERTHFYFGKEYRGVQLFALS